MKNFTLRKYSFICGMRGRQMPHPAQPAGRSAGFRKLYEAAGSAANQTGAGLHTGADAALQRRFAARDWGLAA